MEHRRHVGDVARMVSFWMIVVSSVLSMQSVQGFAPSPTGLGKTPRALHATGGDLKAEAERLLAKAKELRSEISDGTVLTENVSDVVVSKEQSPWNVPESEDRNATYRMYIDIGREEGTWMDPRWGASGRRIEFTLDVAFLLDLEATDSIQRDMVKDNFGGQSSSTKMLVTAKNARLRSGFDRMPCQDGGYRIDVGRNGASTVRFFVYVDGTEEIGASYGDVSVPQGCLYFSLPCFQGGASQLSTKEGIVTVRQIGWHTGWRREESRIVGTFRAALIDKAKARDGF